LLQLATNGYYGILGFPIIIPQLMLLMQLANTVFSDKTGIAFSTLLLIVMLDVLVVMLAVILFPFLWKD
jgi:heme exporter protein B